MKKVQALIVGLVAAGAVAAVSPWHMLASMAPGALHVWSSDEVVTSSDLNGNFTFLNTAKVGGGVQATNSDISTSAGIAHSKMATPALLPKAWAHVAATCAASPCTLADSSQITSIARTGAGVYTVTLAYTPANNNFAQIVTAHVAALFCATTATATVAPHITLRCYDAAGSATDSAFSLLVMDS